MCKIIRGILFSHREEGCGGLSGCGGEGAEFRGKMAVEVITSDEKFQRRSMFF